MNKKVAIILGVVFLVLVLFSWGIGSAVRGIMRAANHDGSSSGSSIFSSNSEDAVAGYTKAYAKLVDTFGFVEEYNNYKKADIANATTQNSIFVDAGWIPQGIEELKKARKEGGSKDLKNAADNLLDALDKVNSHMSQLEPYYKSKAYMDDNLARGKREDGQMLQEFAAADGALQQFFNALNTATDEYNADRMKKYKSDGQMAQYDALLAVQQAKNIVLAMRSASNLNDPSLFQKCDGQIKELDTTLADLRLQTAKMNPHDYSRNMLTKTDAELVNTFLTSMIGNYRELKMSGGSRSLDSVTSSYNNAAGEVEGTVQFPKNR